MAQALILDSEALNALANPSSRGSLFERARAILRVAHDNGALVRVPAPVLAELYRGPRFDPSIDHVLGSRGILVSELSRDLARVAGHLLARSKLASTHAIDAFVVATAASFDSAVIATGDPTDIRRLAAPLKNVRVFAL
jgi:predicted nucleic acid-binding protein